MPPARQAEGMTQAGNAEPSRQGDGIVLGGPDPPLWHRNLEAEPVGPRRAIAAPVEPGMVGQDLQAGPHDEQHEEHVQEVLKLQPPGKPRIDRRRSLRDPGMLPDKVLYAGKFTQALSQGNQAEQRRGRDRQTPQHVDPAPAYANTGRNSILWRHPVIETDAVVCIAKLGTKWLSQRRWRTRAHWPIVFSHRARPAIETSIVKLGERDTLVKGDMVRLAALDLVLGIVGARMVDIAFDLELARMHAGDRTADASRLGVPAHAIMDLESLRHDRSIRCGKRNARRQFSH